MPERISRPPIKLAGELPDGRSNGLVAAAPHFLVDTAERWAIVKLVRRDLTHDDDTGADVARVRVAQIAVAPGGDEAANLAVLAAGWLDEVAGQAALPLEMPGKNDRGRYEDALAGWQKAAGITDADVQAKWNGYFGAAQVVGPLGSETTALAEFVLEVAPQYLEEVR